MLNVQIAFAFNDETAEKTEILSAKTIIRMGSLHFSSHEPDEIDHFYAGPRGKTMQASAVVFHCKQTTNKQ